jgi:CRISPR type III-B/RAMP module RAMP protein Cmr6
MSEIPLPSRIRELLALEAPGNRSLLFDKGMNGYAPRTWEIGAKAKETFLQSFKSAFQPANGDYTDFLKRRAAAFKALGASCRELVTQTRLVIGLGLPSPIETGFLFDRCTGSPYLPGSSVKGALRAAARLVQQDELPGEKGFWSSNLERIFGPEITPGSIPQTGKAIFYDAFPTAWPMLEVDVLTPHYGAYYREGVAPGDWDDPVPVPFLAVAPGTSFHFYMRAEKADFDQLAMLLDTALDWLGIGAKKASGYGVFGKEAPLVAKGAAPRKTYEPPPPPPPPPPKSELSWDNVELSMRKGVVTARRGNQTATCRRDEVGPKILDALGKKTAPRADVEVLKISGGDYRLVRIKGLRPPGN